ncbi:MAG: cytochrome oxidase assembly protein [Thermogutta sp.]|nr:cytochrome oxidase assembly protein [Thermogutta sp.]
MKQRGDPPSRGAASASHQSASHRDVPRLPHRLAWALMATVFPLIWMGGLVTTYNAGMAVPDWPSTYGYLFMYPLESWLKTWDVFLEHGHRLIGMTAGFLTIALLWSLWVHDRRPWMRKLGIAALLGVSLQGTLGGLRVVGREILLANVHGCVAPLFFAFTVSLTVLTSPRWRREEKSRESEPNAGENARPARRTFHPTFILSLPILVYIQIVLGAQLRHLPSELPPGWSFLWTILHLTVAALLPIVWGACSWYAAGLPSPFAQRRWLQAFGWLLVLQITLGLGTWVVNYNFPQWFQDWVVVIPYTVIDGGWLQALVTTAHTATGSLLLAVATAYAHWALAGAKAAARDHRFITHIRAAGSR